MQVARQVTLTAGQLSDWVTLRFQAAPGITVSGITRLLVIEMDDHFSLYMSPINLDPEKPAMPISHPLYYSTYLAKRIGPYATLGLAEDTWALNEGVTDERVVPAADLRHRSRARRTMFFAALDRLRTGTLVCVFDATDRIQHMFWRYLDPKHPARRTAAGRPPGRDPRSLPAQRRAGRPRHAAARRRRRADGDVRPRLQLVPPRRQPERVAAARRAISR